MLFVSYPSSFHTPLTGTPIAMALPLLFFPLLIQPAEGRFGVLFMAAVEDGQTHVCRLPSEKNLQTTCRMVRHLASQVRRDFRFASQVFDLLFRKAILWGRKLIEGA